MQTASSTYIPDVAQSKSLSLSPSISALPSFGRNAALVLVIINAAATKSDIMNEAIPGLLVGLAEIAGVDPAFVWLVYLQVR